MKKRRILSLLLVLVMAVPMFAFGAAPVSASGSGEIDWWIDYLFEALFVGPELRYGPDFGDGVIMYALNLQSESNAALSRARWFPTYSNVIDISRIIPARERARPYIIALRWLDLSGSANAHEPVTTDDVIFVTISARQQIERNAVQYCSSNQWVIPSGLGFEARLENDWHNPSNGWTPMGNNTDPAAGPGQGPLRAPVNAFPAGGTFVARRAAVSGSGGEAGRFASASVRVRIPQQPRAPQTDRIGISDSTRRIENDFISNITDRMEVYIGGGRGWQRLDRNMTVKEFDALFQDTNVSETRETVSFEIRFSPTGNRPASASATIRFSQDRYNSAVRPASPTEIQ